MTITEEISEVKEHPIRISYSDSNSWKIHEENPWTGLKFSSSPKVVKTPNIYTRYVRDRYEFDINILNCDFILPLALKELAVEIHKSKTLLNLNVDWDDELEAPITEETLKRAVHFVVDYAKWLNKYYFHVLKPPQINPGPDGSIDLLWRSSNYRLLINIPADPETLVDYYGDNYHQNSFKGKINSDSVQEFFALWLKNI